LEDGRRVVVKVEHHAGELFPRVGFVVTNLTLPSRAVVRFYNKRGTAEQWIKEGKQAVKMTRLSCHRFRSNEVRLWLSVIAYNLGNLWRRLVLPKRIDNWSLTSFQQRLVKTGGRLVKHALYYLVALGGESCDETVVWQDAPADSRGPGSREIDPEPPGTERCLTKLDGKAAVSGLGTHVAAAPALSRAAGPRQRTNRALEPREGYMLWGGWELKRKYRIGGLSVNLTGIMPSAIL
jgi:hypothetical protein